MGSQLNVRVLKNFEVNPQLSEDFHRMSQLTRKHKKGADQMVCSFSINGCMNYFDPFEESLLPGLEMEFLMSVSALMFSNL